MPWGRYAAAALVSASCTALAELMYPYFEPTNLVMVYLLGATIAALRLGRGPAALVAVANVALFDFCFVPPRYTFAVTDFQYLVTFGVMLVVALVIGTLVASVRAQTRVAGARERRTSLLYAMSRELVATRSLDDLAAVAVKHVAESFASQVTVLLPDAAGRIRHPRGAPLAASFRGADLAVAQWVADHGRAAGFGTDTLPASPAQYQPLKDARGVQGVLAVLPSQRRRLLLPEQQHLLETFAAQVALALERLRLAAEAESARVTAETENLRNTLLSSISHDLRTPLSVIAGAGSTLADPNLELDPATRRSLAASIESKSREMSELISNVLDLMRFESGRVALRRDWQTIDDLVGTALGRSAVVLADHPVELALPPDLPQVQVDATLMLQLLVNLLVNVARHTPPGTPLRVGASVAGHALRIEVADRGPGLPPGDPERLFAKFQRGQEEGNAGGAGLGLAICRVIAESHGGSIRAGANPGGGALFTVTLPLEPAAP